MIRTETCIKYSYFWDWKSGRQENKKYHHCNWKTRYSLVRFYLSDCVLMLYFILCYYLYLNFPACLTFTFPLFTGPFWACILSPLPESLNLFEYLLYEVLYWLVHFSKKICHVAWMKNVIEMKETSKKPTQKAANPEPIIPLE